MTKPDPRDRPLRLIAALKFVKAAFLLAVGLGALELLNPSAAEPARRWATALAWRLRPRAGPAVAEALEQLPHSRIEVFSALVFAWAALFAVEGVGLWNRKRWAENLTLVATASFLPVEIFELIRRLTWPRALALTFNLLVVGYLLWRRQRKEK